VYLLSRTRHFIVVVLGKRKSSVRDDVCLETQVARTPCGGLDSVVCADPYDSDAANATGVQPTFKTSVDEGVRYIFLDNVFTVEWS